MKQETVLQRSWVWNKDVEWFVRKKIIGYTLNVCAGLSDIGDVRVDLDPKKPSVQKADMTELPYDDNTFDTVIEDPPWKIGYYDRWKPFFECIRVCKMGGQIIYNAYWLPQSDDCELVETYIRADNPFTNASIISVFKKVNDRRAMPLFDEPEATKMSEEGE
jgi:ubiquinone/menaquinone biosynthesis C-methylase UbiE